ncbi:MAG: hypothetical protein QXS74_06395 [Nitrososphaeria archaeon]
MKVKCVYNCIYWTDEEGKPYNAKEIKSLPSDKKLEMVVNRDLPFITLYYCQLHKKWETMITNDKDDKLLTIAPDCERYKILKEIKKIDCTIMNYLEQNELKKKLVDEMVIRFRLVLLFYLSHNLRFDNYAKLVKLLYKYTSYPELKDIMKYINKLKKWGDLNGK